MRVHNRPGHTGPGNVGPAAGRRPVVPSIHSCEEDRRVLQIKDAQRQLLVGGGWWGRRVRHAVLPIV